jgi:putative SOS response-associated peptidase YedK
MLGCKSHFNVAPSQTMPVIVQHEHIEGVTMQWGLISHGVTDPKKSTHPINTRADTLSQKSLFSSLLNDHRCLIPASGFYEWKKEGSRKIPFYIRVKDEPVFAFAGLYDEWQDSQGNNHPTYTIITTEPNTVVSTIHNRMPVILTRENEKQWLSGDTLARHGILEILGSYPPDKMEAYPVSSRVNRPDVDDERLIQPLETL